jgi:hypothetical protein
VISPAKTGLSRQNFLDHTLHPALQLVSRVPLTSTGDMSANNDVYQTPLNSRYASKCSFLRPTNEGPNNSGSMIRSNLGKSPDVAGMRFISI